MKRLGFFVSGKAVGVLLVLFCAQAVFGEIIVSDIVSNVSMSSYSNYLDDLLYTHNGDDRDSVDTAGYIDYAFATNVVSSAVGLFADAAMPIPEPASVVLLAMGVLAIRKRNRPHITWFIT